MGRKRRGSPLMRVNHLMTVDQVARLEALSARLAVDRSTLVRLAVTEFLDRHGRDTVPPEAPPLLGMGDPGVIRGDVRNSSRREAKSGPDLEDEADARAAREAIDDVERHGTVPWEQVKRDIGL